MTTLTCTCGRRLNVRGISPGKKGRCPACGEFVRVPPAATPVDEDEWNWQGTYGIEAENPKEATPPKEDEWDWDGVYDVAEPPPPVAVPTPIAPVAKETPPREPEPWFPPRLFFPGRSVEGVAIVSAIGFSLWLLATLVPEYCIALLSDADGLGALPMGHLVAIVTSLPVALFAPLVAAYWIQYLGRVLVGGAEGERNPPRPPDRNADSLLGGLLSWAIWIALGLTIGALPLAAGCLGRPWNPERALGLGLIGLPYALMALLLTFLHEDDFAARPWMVAWSLMRVGPSFLILSLVTAATLGAGACAIAGLLRLRQGHFGWYIAGSLGGWLLLVWLTLVAMHTLGAYFYARRNQLKWRRPRPWWEVG
jgi:hypothetical protein